MTSAYTVIHSELPTYKSGFAYWVKGPLGVFVSMPHTTEKLAQASANLFGFEKECYRCQTIKPLDMFYAKSDSKDGYESQCKDCRRELRKSGPDREMLLCEGPYCLRKAAKRQNKRVLCDTHQWQAEEGKPLTEIAPRRARGSIRSFTTPQKTVLYKYKMTPEQFEALLAAQDGHCALCPNVPDTVGRAFHIDHDHRCCPTSKGSPKTCGECTRGILCSRCNSGLVSGYEALPQELQTWDWLSSYINNRVDWTVL